MALRIVCFSPKYGPAGTIVQIKGEGFASARAVKFNRTKSTSFTVSGDSLIKAKVPAGATSGRIEVAGIADKTETAEFFTI